ncbi:MAG: hypothetical protein QM642_10030 [Edaphocola sp.]
MRRILLAASLLLTFGLVSCEKETEDLSEISKGNKFFPLEIGKYIVYNYDSLYWDDLLQTSTPYTGQMRYDVVDTFRDAGGRLSYRITIKSRRNGTDAYVANDVVYATPTETQLLFSQRNITFIKMVFPVANGTTWKGNALIPVADEDYAQYDGDNWNYTYANFDQPYDPGGNPFEHTVTVNEIDDALNDPDVDTTAYAYRNYSQAVYAYNVGLIYSERIYWVFQPKVGSSGGSGYRKGYEVRMWAIENN